MRLKTDQQTINDLNIYGRTGSIFEIYNKTKTVKGSALLKEMFLNPLSDPALINRRSETIAFFKSAKSDFPFSSEQFDHLELYFDMDDRTILSEEDNSLKSRMGKLIAENTDYAQIHNGVTALIGVVHLLKVFINSLDGLLSNISYSKNVEELKRFILSPELAVLPDGNTGKIQLSILINFDKKLRARSTKLICREILDQLYLLDVYMSVAQVAKRYGLCFPKALVGDKIEITIGEVSHPTLTGAVKNNLVISPEHNIVFLTGANMAGKSTFMKSVCVALFTAHVGFPVFASYMQFNALEGIYTTINLPDNINSGNSHFYEEVLRVKKMAKEVATGQKCFILFDELFRGTNVKDAHEATVLITEGFSKRKNCVFMISTHIIEAGADLGNKCDNINFIYLPTYLEGAVPRYTYRLEKGLTGDRHGMIIIQNEGILDILNKPKNKNISK